MRNAGSPAISVVDASAVPRRPAPPQAHTSQPAAPAAQPPARQDVEAAVVEANKAMKAAGANLQFIVDPETKMTVIKIVDADSHTVLRQIPAQEMLDVAQALERMKGVLLKQEA